MNPYSAMDSISPAIERTKNYLFKPFQLGRFLKLALVAAFAEGSYSGMNSNFNFPFPGKSTEHMPLQFPQMHWPAPGVWIAIALVFILFMVPLSIVISYLLIRLRFSYFDCVLYGHDQISSGWRKYHRQALRYLGVSLLVGLAFLAVLVAVGLSVWSNYKADIIDFITALSHNTRPSVDIVTIVSALAGVFFVIFLLAIVGYVFNSTMTYFVLPRMALEDSPASQAFADVWDDMKAEPGQFALFLLMRALLAIAASLIAVFVMIVPLILIAIVAVIVGLLIKALVHSTFVLILLGVIGVLILLALFFVLAICLGGTVGTFTRNYGMLFYAGRYPELAARLWPAPPVPGIPIGRPGEVF